MQKGKQSVGGQAQWGLMAGRQLRPHWVLHLLHALLMMETMSGASSPSIGAHTSPEFPASGVDQSPVVDVSIQAGSCRQVGGVLIQSDIY